MINNDLKYPSMREELLRSLLELSDAEYQRNKWLPENSLNGIPESNLDYSVHFLFDDTSLSTSPEKCIGWFLNDEREAKLVFEVIQTLSNIFTKYGTEMEGRDYIQLREWADVVRKAKFAYDAIK
ncbi:hypothetical protein [Ochrobactrum sp. Marseille-Q0166]|uniref:SCO4402 family protein n=1 Tax=Ochrobactrum sp. Marseille-Q0166 TaxID=2761105 RepID=UPI001654F9F5|nr:hypothetical protein [Ochrobactrum sp. Marseille-Q0166]MBC8719178.1 hypothetical protein [Ochrobactrum sp. Marseille-Q0166]